MNTEETKVLVTGGAEDRLTQLGNLAAGIAKTRLEANPDQIVELDQLERRVKRALGIRRVKPALALNEVVLLNTEFGEHVEHVLKIKADGSLRVTNAHLLAGEGEIVQIKAPINGAESLTDYIVSSCAKGWTALRLLSPDEIEARKAAVEMVDEIKPEAALTNLVNDMTDGVIARTNFNIALMNASTSRTSGGTKPLSAAKLARTVRKLNRQQGAAARAAQRRAAQLGPVGADGLPAHAEAA